MSARGFRSVFMVGGVATAALGCYLVSLNVASERAELERVETKIVLAQRDVRVLQTEIGTRGRLAQLERWNASAIRLSAPSVDQFANDGFQLAALVRPDDKAAIDAPIVYASATTDQIAPRAEPTDDGASATSPAVAAPRLPGSASPADLMHVASYSRPAPATANAVSKMLTATKSATLKPLAKLPATKPAKTAMADPLSPLPKAKPKPKASASSKPATKDSGTP